MKRSGYWIFGTAPEQLRNSLHETALVINENIPRHCAALDYVDRLEEEIDEITVPDCTSGAKTQEVLIALNEAIKKAMHDARTMLYSVTVSGEVPDSSLKKKTSLMTIVVRLVKSCTRKNGISFAELLEAINKSQVFSITKDQLQLILDIHISAENIHTTVDDYHFK